MSPFETAEFRAALKEAVVETINKIGFNNFKRLSWFASNHMINATKQAA